jgi:Lon protease-like protein
MLVDFPIFGAGINYFPTEISALRVFEPRYLLLIGDAIKDDKNFLVSKNLEDYIKQFQK